MDNSLFLFVGRSASGKTTVADVLEKEYGYKQVSSYTTRKPRYDGEIGHTFVTEDEFNQLEDIVAYTLYNNAHYGTTAKQLDECSIYVVDVPGVETLLERYKNDRPIVVIYFDSSVYTRINRMIDRGDSDMQIISRLLQDEKDDWHHDLDALVWHSTNIENRNVKMYVINANSKKDEVLKNVLDYIKEDDV